MKFLVANLLYVTIIAVGVVGAFRADPKTATVPAAMTQTVQLHEQAATIWDLRRQSIEQRKELLRAEEALLNVAGAKLQAERTDLEAQLRTAVGAPSDATVDWSKSPPVVTWPAEKKP